MLVLSCWSKPTEIILSQFWRLEVRNLHFLWGSQRKCALTSEHFVVTDSLGLRAMSLHSLSLSPSSHVLFWVFTAAPTSV